ncbi:FadR family transcriptional regulator (plasmid) [Skermanella rosea]|uniref:FadR/GntR family transcriptional regulator n=1 Tax=Skermanella rosea TaxID=1817965 RepID=UPI00193201D9|nr:FadR/GntR family transcriptional regulator [Skermanella rosea]UEM07775.1 FadR family transcriptional regulator [Skermanella rosea]
MSAAPGEAPPPPVQARQTQARQTKLSDRIYEQVLGLIVNGEFPVDAKLPAEADLSARFACSRPVVREALARLRDDGLIVSRQGAGSFVRRRPDRDVLRIAPVGSIADIQRCFEFRAVIEGEAAAFAAARHDRDTLADIGVALKALDAVIASGSLGVEADLNFHLAIARAARNHFFEATMISILTHVGFAMNLARSLSLARPIERLHQVQAEHIAIFEAISARDAEGARHAMRTHVENARQRVFEGQ